MFAISEWSGGFRKFNLFCFALLIWSCWYYFQRSKNILHNDNDIYDFLDWLTNYCLINSVSVLQRLIPTKSTWINRKCYKWTRNISIHTIPGLNQLAWHMPWVRALILIHVYKENTWRLRIVWMILLAVKTVQSAANYQWTLRQVRWSDLSFRHKIMLEYCRQAGGSPLPDRTRALEWREEIWGDRSVSREHHHLCWGKHGRSWWDQIHGTLSSMVRFVPQHYFYL